MNDVFSVYSAACLMVFAVGYCAGVAVRVFHQMGEAVANS